MPPLPLPDPPTTVYAEGVEVESADLNALETFELAIKTFIEAGIWTRTALDDDSPVLAATDQDANIKDWIDANGYGFGQVLSENYWWKAAGLFAAGNNVSMGSPFYLTAEETGFVVSAAAPPGAEIGCRMIKIACTATPTTFNGALLSCDDGAASGNNSMFSNLDDAVAVAETTFITDEVADSASSFYFGFHDPGSDPGSFESNSLESCCIALDYGESVFEGMTCDGTTSSKSTTGTACVVDTLYHLRVEYHGANTPKGVEAEGAVARFFINGALVLEKTTNMPGNTAWMGPAYGAMGLGSGTASNLHIGPVHWAVNYVPSSQVPA